MLTLQRASAGSGKTYTLARTFIRHLIADDRPGTKPTLREYEALEDAISHILAVTFTNKATNEMKQRIVEKLFLLSRTDIPEEKVDYLKDFMKEFGATREQIATRCALALKYLLLDFSNFNVSTIDSFFQTILRTFAYEAELPETYKLEIDTDYISAVGVDAVINNMITANLDPETYRWVDFLSKQSMEEEQDWNIQNKRIVKGQTTLYEQLLIIAQKLDSESFKQISGSLDRYFENGGSLSAAFDTIEDHFMPPIESAFATLQNVAHEMLRQYAKVAPKGIADIGRSGAIKNLRKIVSQGADPAGEHKWEEITKTKNALNKAAKKLLGKETDDMLHSYYDVVSDAYREWKASFNQPGMEIWKHLRKQIPYLALLYTFRREIREYLDRNGMMVLGDTNTLLRRIIADDDVPFIYERLGTHIDHYLIDEFQDTSRMQWDNFRPLLSQSIANGMDNLIIGDAKQSIYRFRNADPTIISDVVPATFPADSINICGQSIDQNSNWRSDLHIVQFNNYIFDSFHHEYAPRLGNLYAGAVQYPRKQNNRGYVEWTPYPHKKEELGIEDKNIDKETGNKTKRENNNYDVIGPMISEMLSRGYRQKDIAVLCNKNDNAMKVIAALMDYNSGLPSDAPQLKFVSEQSLQLGSNGAVNVIISALRSLAEGVYTPPTDEDTPQKRTRADWASMATQFTIFSHAHSDIPLSERISAFFDDARADDSLSKMVSKMQATTLPALVEAIADMFLHNGVAGGGNPHDTPFLAAFQDSVLEYCDMHCADITSFLDWWEKKGKSMSISSPEGTDAINIMTIHKSKGLEFECVILPDIDLKLISISSSWGWAKVPDTFPFRNLLPERVPVEISNAIDAEPDPNDPDKVIPGPFTHLLDEEKVMSLSDSLNKIYVAFTRAVSELYILTDIYNVKNKDTLIKDENKLRTKLADYLKQADARLQRIEDDKRNLFIDPAKLAEPVEFHGITYGTRPSAEDVADRIVSKSKSDTDKSHKEISGYYINADQDVLRFEQDGITASTEDEDTTDPRSEGSIIHGILERTVTYDDLHSGVTNARLRGLLTTPEADAMEAMLAEALEATRSTHWFDGTQRVINERPILRRGTPMRRPDRILVDKDNHATVVDYKTGTSEKNSHHHRQVEGYVARLKETGLFTDVEGWLWYIKEGKIEKV